MLNNLKEIAGWIFEQGTNITREAIEEKLQDAYNKGRIDAFNNIVDKTLEDIQFNTINKIRMEKKKLYENNFYEKPAEEDVIKMKALTYVEEHIGEIISQYKK